MPRRRYVRRLVLLSSVAFVWILLSLYPNPLLLAKSIPQGLQPQADPEAVAEWARDLPDDPALIERKVLDEHVPYAVPWETHGVPWYFPTAAEVVERGLGTVRRAW